MLIIYYSRTLTSTEQDVLAVEILNTPIDNKYKVKIDVDQKCFLEKEELTLLATS